MLAKSVPFTAEISHWYTTALLRLLLALYATSAAETTYPPLYSHCLAVHEDTVSLDGVYLIAQVCEVGELLALTILMTPTVA